MNDRKHPHRRYCVLTIKQHKNAQVLVEAIVASLAHCKLVLLCFNREISCQNEFFTRFTRFMWFMWYQRKTIICAESTTRQIARACNYGGHFSEPSLYPSIWLITRMFRRSSMEYVTVHILLEETRQRRRGTATKWWLLN